jgi:4-hydroxybenzoate polyprenyltransferase
MADQEDDERVGVNSSARFFGRHSAQAVGFFFAATAALMAGLGAMLSLNLWFWLSLVIALFGWGWQYQRLRTPSPKPTLYGQIFQQNVWIGFVLLAGMTLGFSSGF